MASSASPQPWLEEPTDHHSEAMDLDSPADDNREPPPSRESRNLANNWEASYGSNRKTIGTYDTKEAAGLAYDLKIFEVVGGEPPVDIVEEVEKARVLRGYKTQVGNGDGQAPPSPESLANKLKNNTPNQASGLTATGVPGLYYDEKKWVVRLSINNDSEHIGTFENLIDAIRALLDAKDNIHPVEYNPPQPEVVAIFRACLPGLLEMRQTASTEEHLESQSKLKEDLKGMKLASSNAILNSILANLRSQDLNLGGVGAVNAFVPTSATNIGATGAYDIAATGLFNAPGNGQFQELSPPLKKRRTNLFSASALDPVAFGLGGAAYGQVYIPVPTTNLGASGDYVFSHYGFDDSTLDALIKLSLVIDRPRRQKAIEGVRKATKGYGVLYDDNPDDLDYVTEDVTGETDRDLPDDVETEGKEVTHSKNKRKFSESVYVAFKIYCLAKEFALDRSRADGYGSVALEVGRFILYAFEGFTQEALPFDIEWRHFKSRGRLREIASTIRNCWSDDKFEFPQDFNPAKLDKVVANAFEIAVSTLEEVRGCSMLPFRASDRGRNETPPKEDPRKVFEFEDSVFFIDFIDLRLIEEALGAGKKVYLIITHAHLDHVGAVDRAHLQKLVDGKFVKIYWTEVTAAVVCNISIFRTKLARPGP